MNIFLPYGIPRKTSEKMPFWPRMVATMFGAGFCPVAPGTMGALVAIVLWLPLALIPYYGLVMMVMLACIMPTILLGYNASEVAELYWGEDPKCVVVDETLGQWIALLPMTLFCNGPESYHDWKFWLIIGLAFVLFRFFDIVKPLGIRKMESYEGGFGILMDDMLAGIYSMVLITPLAMYLFVS